MASSQAQISKASRPAPGSGPADVNLDIENSRKLKGLVGVVNSLKETDLFQEYVQLHNENELLRASLISRDETVARLQEEGQKSMERQDTAIQAFAASHQRSLSKVTADAQRKDKTILSLREIVKNEAKERAKVEIQAADREAELTKLKNELRGSEETSKGHSKKAAELEKQLQQTRSDSEDLRKELHRERAETSKLNKTKVALEKAQEAMVQQHNFTRAELAGFQRLTVSLNTEDLAVTTRRMESIWQSASSIVMEHLQAELNPACLTSTESWKHLKNPTGMPHNIPLPRSNTPVAKDMRSAVVLAYLFHKINLELFQPNYAMHEDLDGRDTLLHRALENSQDESLYRSFLLSVCPEDQARIATERANGIVADVVWLVKEILPEDLVEDFRADLHGLLDSVCADWQKIQRLSTRFEPNMEYTMDKDFQWQALQLESEAPVSGDRASTDRYAADRVELVVFPRLYVAEDEVPRPVTSGVVLWHSQTAAAAQELRNESLPSPTFIRSFSTRSQARRDSVTANEALSKSTRSAFLARRTSDGHPNGVGK